MSLKLSSLKAWENIPGRRPKREVTFDLDRVAKVIGGVVLTLAAIGLLANLHDIRRYARMKMM